MFDLCTSLTSIDLSNTAITSIQSSTFSECTSLTSINFPDTLNSIGYGAFKYYNKLASITFQGSAPTLGSDVFYNTGTSVDDGLIISIYKEHEASYASWRDLYTFRVIGDPTTGLVGLVLQPSYNPSNQAFNIITKGENSADTLVLQHTANLGGTWAAVNTSDYTKSTDANSGTVTRTVTLDTATQPTGFYRLVSE